MHDAIDAAGEIEKPFDPVMSHSYVALKSKPLTKPCEISIPQIIGLPFTWTPARARQGRPGNRKQRRAG
jgi:hypothetical protein